MKRLIKKLFHGFGFEIRKAQQPFVPQVKMKLPPVDSMLAGLMRMKKININPKCIIDLGAAAGTWTLKAETVWPEADFLMFEPLEERKNDLELLQSRNSKLVPVFAAAGSKTGKIRFVVSSDLDGSGVYEEKTSGDFREVELTTIDDEIKKRKLKGPYFLKFDTHGFELPILEGSVETLKETELIVMECYGFLVANNSLLLHEMCSHMEKLGFRLADQVDVMRRPGDDLFWQCDLFFLKSSNELFKRTTYAP